MECYEHYCFVCDRMEDHGNVSDDDEETACCVLLCEDCEAMHPDDGPRHGISFGL